MTILRFKNPTNMYRIDAKKQGGERVYLALEDLRIKSRFSRSNMSIREVGWSGERKIRDGGERWTTLGEEGWAGVKCRGLGAIHSGAEPPGRPFPRAQELGASHSGAEPRVHFRNSFRQGSICEKLSKKGPNSIKFGAAGAAAAAEPSKQPAASR